MPKSLVHLSARHPSTDYDGTYEPYVLIGLALRQSREMGLREDLSLARTIEQVTMGAICSQNRVFS